jgi:hypothetical protein
MMTFIQEEIRPGVMIDGVWQTMPDINGGPNRIDQLTEFPGWFPNGESEGIVSAGGNAGAALTIESIQATFPGMVQTANGKYTGEVTGSDADGMPVHFGADGWMVGQTGCILDERVYMGSGVASLDLPDLSWCGVNEWIGRNRGLAALGLIGLFMVTKVGARKVRERRARR